MGQLSLGLCGTSGKENEHRLPIHPPHIDRIDAGLRAGIFLERGYGERFGVADAQLARLVAGVRSRAAAHHRMRRDRAAQAHRTRHCRAAGRPGAVGLAALRPGLRRDPAGASTAG